MNVRFLSLANQEVADAVQWYDEKAEGLGREFLDELDRVVRLVRAYPFMATQIEEEVRRFLIYSVSVFSNLRYRPGNDRGHCRRTPTSRAAILG
jgi:hypothetical protein